MFAVALAAHIYFEPTNSTVTWAPCDPAFIHGTYQVPFDCAFFGIPLDWHDPAAGVGRLSLIKANATGIRKGTLFINPGQTPSSDRPPCVLTSLD